MANFSRRSLLESSQQQNPDAHLSPLHHGDEDNQIDVKFAMTVANGGQEIFFFSCIIFQETMCFLTKFG